MNSQEEAFEAIRSGDISKARKMIEQQGDFEGKDPYRAETFLMVSVYWGHMELIEFLLANGASVTRKSSIGDTALHLAAERGWIDITRVLVEGGADVEARNERGRTPLFCACIGDAPSAGRGRTNYLALVELLIERGAAADTTGRNDAVDCSAIMAAALKGKQDVVLLLLGSGASLEGTDSHGDGILSYAMSGNHVGLAEILIERGARPVGRVIYPQNEHAWMEKLVALGANADAANARGVTALMASCRDLNAGAVSYLVGLRCEVDAVDHEGSTALMYACRAQGTVRSDLGFESKRKTLQTEIVSLLLQAGADIDAKSKDGSAPLTIADKENNMELRKLLIGKGARTEGLQLQLDESSWAGVLLLTSLTGLGAGAGGALIASPWTVGKVVGCILAGVFGLVWFSQVFGSAFPFHKKVVYFVSTITLASIVALGVPVLFHWVNPGDPGATREIGFGYHSAE